MNKAPLSQCDKCGSEVPPDQITKEDPWYEFKILFLGVIIGGLLSRLFLWIQLG